MNQQWGTRCLDSFRDLFRRPWFPIRRDCDGWSRLPPSRTDTLAGLLGQVRGRRCSRDHQTPDNPFTGGDPCLDLDGVLRTRINGPRAAPISRDTVFDRHKDRRHRRGPLNASTVEGAPFLREQTRPEFARVARRNDS
jgi:hypothetical protein